MMQEQSGEGEKKQGSDKTMECFWNEDDYGIYETECGNSFCFEAGTIGENEFEYCPFCGQPITFKPFLSRYD